MPGREQREGLWELLVTWSFFTWVLSTQMCLVFENSLSYILMRYDLFCVYVILPPKVSKLTVKVSEYMGKCNRKWSCAPNIHVPHPLNS